LTAYKPDHAREPVAAAAEARAKLDDWQATKPRPAG
jgi:hypothetical protein